MKPIGRGTDRRRSGARPLYRISHIQRLMNAGQLDASLRWIPVRATAACVA